MPFYIPTNNVWGCQFFKSSPTRVTVRLFYCSHSGGYLSIVLICDFWWSMVVCVWPCAYWPFVYRFRRNILWNPLPVCQLGHLLFILDLQKFFFVCVVDTSPFLELWFENVSSNLQVVLFCLDSVFWRINISLILIKFNFSIVFFLSFMLLSYLTCL